MIKKTQFHLLATRRFLPLFITQFLEAFNDQAFKAALVMFITFSVVSEAKHAQLLVNLATGLYGLPFFLFSPFAGQLADKFERSFLARLIKFSEVILMTIGALGFYWSSIPLLIGVLFCIGTHTAFFGPIKYSILPNLLQPEELLGGNGLIQAGTVIAALSGAAYGTVSGGTTHEVWFASTVIITVAGCGLLSCFFIPKIPVSDSTLKLNFNFLKEIYSLICHIQKNKPVFYAILGISIFIFASFSVLTQFPVYIRNTMGGSKQVVAFVLVTFASGMAVGSLLCNRILKGTVSFKAVPIGLFGMSLLTLDLSWTSSKITHPLLETGEASIHTLLSTILGVHMILDLFLLAIFSGIYMVPLYAIMQAQSDSNYISRTIACNNLLASLFGVLSAVIIMVMVSLGCSATGVFLAIGLVEGLIGLYVIGKK